MEGVAYLESADFNPDMSLKPNVNKGKPVVVMCQSLGCGFCTMAKPAFIDFNNSVQNAIAATIQIDAETELGQKIPSLDKSFRGVPTYLGFNKEGKYVKTHSGGRDKESLINFANSL